MIVRKYALFKLIILCCLQVYSQQINSDISILGHIQVQDESYFRFKILLFEERDSIINTTYTDSSRNYILIIPRKNLKGKKLTLLVEEVPPNPDEQFYKRRTYCGISYPRPKHLNGYRAISTGQIDSANYIKFDIQLSRLCYELRFPSVEFQENKLRMLPSHGETPDSVLRCMVEVLQENPGFVIEISAHSDLKEKEPEKMAEFRGEMIKNMLVCFGINPHRLIVKSYGCRRLLVTKYEIKKIKSMEEEDVARQMNRRVVFSVLRKDFIE